MQNFRFSSRKGAEKEVIEFGKFQQKRRPSLYAALHHCSVKRTALCGMKTLFLGCGGPGGGLTSPPPMSNVFCTISRLYGHEMLVASI
jgi:hypothetical protein